MAKKVGNTYYFTGKGKSSGGGGGGGDAVLYTEQTLTESQQMQARKNQGLYYTESGLVEKTLTVTEADLQGKVGTADFVQIAGNMQNGACVIRISEDMPSAENIKSVFTQDSWDTNIQITDYQDYIKVTVSGGISLLALYVVYEDHAFVETPDGGFRASTGIWGDYYTLNSEIGDYALISQYAMYGMKYDYDGETIHTVEPKYLPLTKTLTSESTDEEVPSAKTVYDIVGDVETLLAAL